MVGRRKGRLDAAAPSPATEAPRIASDGVPVDREQWPLPGLIWARDIAPPAGEGRDTSLWGGTLYPGSIHLVSGESGCGKSTFFYNSALRAAVGEDPVGLPFPRPLRILYIDLETPGKLRARKIHRLLGEGSRPDGLAYLPEVTLFRHLRGLVAPVQEEGFDLVIVDTLALAFDTEREEDNAEAAKQMWALRALVKATGCGIVLVHHIGKGGEGGGKRVYRGRGADLAKRPQFKRLMDDVQTGKLDVVVVHKLDRFARNIRVALEQFDVLNRHGVAFVSLAEQMDFSSPLG
ncbi:MAG: AAA family ATPase [Chloroflexota bacterium]|nr:AAA family ATPase [Chloroflexota bacterium]